MLAKLKKYMPNTLFARALIIMILPVFLAQAVAIYIFYERHWESVSKYLASSLAGEVSLVVNFVEAEDEGEKNDNFLNAMNGIFGMDIIYSDAPKKLTGFESFKHKIYEKALKSKIKNQFEVYINDDAGKIATSVALENGRNLFIQTNHKRLVNSTTYIFIMWMVGTSFILLFISILFLKNQIRPIIRLARLANNFGRGQDSSVEFKPEGAQEIRQAGSAFLNMKERISRHIRQRTEMLAGISHDLRTPLTRMKLEIEMLKEKYKDENIDDLSQDIDEMQTMINSYINFVRADEEEETSQIQLDEFLKDIIYKYEQHGENIEFEKLDEVEIMVRENALRRAVNNLLENSFKYADSTTISLEKDLGFVVISITDDGCGIPEHEREEVFKPFHRVETSRNRETGGTGLGLSIVRDIINGHGGSVHLEEAFKGIGLRAVIKLPI